MNPIGPKAETGHWFLITSRGHWARLRELGCWAFAEKHKCKAGTVQPEHKGIVYLTADGGRHTSVIAAVIRFTGKSGGGSNGKTAFDTFYPLRIPMEVERIPTEPVPIKPLIPHLEFIYNKKNWGSLLQGQPLKPLSISDFKLMEKTLDDAVQREETVP